MNRSFAFLRSTLLSATALAAAMLVASCATNAPRTVADSLPAGELGERSASQAIHPLLNAKYRDIITCKSSKPLSAERTMAEIPFACNRGTVAFIATLPQMKDAGWGMEAIDVGRDYTENGVKCFPVTIKMRKLL